MAYTITYPSQEIPLLPSYDVIVCGGGPAGCAAAISSARERLRVLLLERLSQLGGMGTSGLVSHWLGGRFPDGRWVVGGLFRAMAEEAVEQGFALLPISEPGQVYTPHGWYLGLNHGVPFDPFRMACYLDEKLIDSGVDVLFLTEAVDVIVDDERITNIVIFNKSGLQAIPVRAVVDATGDADIAIRSGCEVTKGRDEDGLMTPVTLEFHVDNVNQQALSDYIHLNKSPRFRGLIKELRAEGIWRFPYDIFISVQLHEKGIMMINTPRITGVDGTDSYSLSHGLRRGRAEIQELFAIMKRYFPGFANAHLKTVAPMIGIRETRRIVGEYILAVDDLISERRFQDTVGYSMYGWDLPDPHKPSFQPLHEQKKPPVTPIPYRIMVPKPVTNLICPGRAVSVERHVLGPLRVMAPVIAMGEAAGTATEQVVNQGIGFRDVDTDILRKKLCDNGAILDNEYINKQ